MGEIKHKPTTTNLELREPTLHTCRKREHGIATRKRDRKGTETLKLWGRHQLPTLPTILEILLTTVCSLCKTRENMLGGSYTAVKGPDRVEVSIP